MSYIDDHRTCGVPMNVRSELVSALRARIAQYDLLCHPFYQAWSAGELTRDELRNYACEYYHHVAAFPAYLSSLHSRLPDGTLRRRVLSNLAGEEIQGRAHSEMWLDFAESMGADRETARRSQADATADAIAWFRNVARQGSIAEALAAFWAYESQVPRVAATKEEGLRERYGADDKACAYFALHKTADVHHARAWEEMLCEELESDGSQMNVALLAAEQAAQQLWQVLDRIEAQRMAKRAAVA